MNIRFLQNPFYCLIASFGLATYVYSWGWSMLYPEFTYELIIFLSVLFGLSLFLGKYYDKYIVYREINIDKRNVFITTFIWLGVIIELIYNKAVPIFQLFSGADIDYQHFGIPTFHVFLVTFTPFFAVYLFHQYLSNRRRLELYLYISLLVPSILIVSRGTLVMTIVTTSIIYIQYIQKIKWKTIVIAFSSIILFFYLFGYIGFVRSFKDNEDYFLDVSLATDEFKENIIPKEYFWFYLYASSPIANFQNATINVKKIRYDVLSYINSELLPDFISKRIFDREKDPDRNNRMNYAVAPFLTVGTIFYDSYIRMGWIGAFTTLIYFLLICSLYLLFIKKTSKYYQTSVAILCSMAIFNVFDNMVSFSGLSFQLFYPIILTYTDRYKLKWPNLRFSFKR